MISTISEEAFLNQHKVSSAAAEAAVLLNARKNVNLANLLAKETSAAAAVATAATIEKNKAALFRINNLVLLNANTKKLSRSVDTGLASTAASKTKNNTKQFKANPNSNRKKNINLFTNTLNDSVESRL